MVILMIRILAPLLIAACLASCTVVPLTTQAALGRLDPLTADPGGFVLHFTLPPGVGLEESSAMFSLTSERSDTGESLASDYGLELMTVSDQGDFAFRIAPSDLDRLRADQARIGAWEAEAPRENSGSFSVHASGCLTGVELTPDARFSAGLQVTEGGPILPLIRNQPIGSLVDLSQEDLAGAACD